MTAPTPEVKPGVYDGMPDDVYHRDPTPWGSLSASGAKLLLPPSCPALFRYRITHPQPHKTAYDLGHGAHLQVLGVGPTVAVIDAKDYKTKAAQEAKRAAYAAGDVPLLREQYEDVRRMAEALAAHPFAGRLFAPGSGRPEQSLFWADHLAEIWCRARLDWLPDPGNGRLIVPDYKTAACADPGQLQRAMFAHGYHIQHWWYLDAIRSLGIADDPAFVFVVQEKTPPYLVTVVELDAAAVRLGELQARRARDVYAECTATDTWPGYTTDVETITPPAWLACSLEEEL